MFLGFMCQALMNSTFQWPVDFERAKRFVQAAGKELGNVHLQHT